MLEHLWFLWCVYRRALTVFYINKTVFTVHTSIKQRAEIISEQNITSRGTFALVAINSEISHKILIQELKDTPLSTSFLS